MTAHTGTPQIGLGLPPDILRVGRQTLQALVAAINQSAITHVAVSDHVSFRGGGGWDALTAMAVLSGLGIDRPLHAGVFILPVRHPTILARQLLDLADVHEHEIVAGVGLGGDDPDEYAMVGLDSRERGRLMDDALPLLRRLLRDEGAIDVGGRYQARGAGLARGSGQPVRVLVGGRSPQAHQRAAESDGWLATFCSPDRFSECRSRMVEASGESLTVGYQAWVGVGDRRAVDAAIARFYGLDPAPFARYTPAGSPNDIADDIRPYVDAGANLVHLFAAADHPLDAVTAVSAVANMLSA